MENFEKSLKSAVVSLTAELVTAKEDAANEKKWADDYFQQLQTAKAEIERLNGLLAAIKSYTCDGGKNEDWEKLMALAQKGS